MSTATTSRTLAWLIGLLLLVCWNLQAEKNPTRHSVQFTKSFNGSTPAVDLPPISLTATVGVPFSATLPRTLPIPLGSSIYSLSVTGLPANGLSAVAAGPGFILGTPLTSGVMNLTVVETSTASQTINSATTWRAYTITVNPSATSFAITGVDLISCQTLSANERQLTFTPQYVGTTGQPINFTVYQQLSLTTQPGPYSLRLDTSNPLITLIAQQNGELTSLNYQWLAACNASARRGALEPAHELSVTVLGNPVVGASAEVEIRGVWGERVQVEVVDLQGRRWHQQVLEQAGTADRIQIPLGTSRGLLLLQVSTASQTQTVKLLKAE